MNILMAASCSSDPNLGVPGVMHSLAAEYRREGHQVRFRFRDAPGRVGEILFGARLASSSDLEWADVVDCHAVEAWPLCARKRRPVVVARSHGLEVVVHRKLLEAKARGAARVSPIYWAYRGSFRLMSERFSIRSSDAAFLLNRHDLDICRDEFGAHPSRLHLVPNGYPSDFARLPLDPSAGGGKIAFVGSWIARKGNDTAVEILNRLLAMRSDVEVLIAGTGHDESTVLRGIHADLHSRVRVIPSFKREELPSILRDHAILLFPSRSEGYPLSLVESMACSLAPVASAIPGVFELVEDGRNGHLAPAESPDGFIDAIIDLLDNPGRLAQFRAQARASVQHDTWDALARNQLRIYGSLREARALLRKDASR